MGVSKISDNIQIKIKMQSHNLRQTKYLIKSELLWDKLRQAKYLIKADFVWVILSWAELPDLRLICAELVYDLVMVYAKFECSSMYTAWDMVPSTQEYSVHVH